MIVPVGRTFRSWRRLRAFLVVCVLLVAWAGAAVAQSTPIARAVRITGNINFVTTGGSLRTQPDTGNSCLVGTTSSENLSGVPPGTTIRAAYLYWGGSGSAVDSTVTFNSSTVVADRTFTAVFNNAGTSFPYFGGVADVTPLVTGNGSYTFGGLSVNTGAPHCGSSAVQAGWGLIVIYQGAAERLRAINIFDGLQFFRGSSLTLTPDGFRIPPSNIDGRIAVITWEGDPGNSTPLNGFSESLTFNGTGLDDGLVPAGSVPTIQQYDGTISSQGSVTSYGVDVDSYDISSALSPGQTTATTNYSAGGDLVLLTAQVVSVTTEPVVDLGVTKSHTGDFSVGTLGTYTITVSNAAGAEKEDNLITVTDVLPSGLTFVSASGTGWSCSASGQTVSCTQPPPLLAGNSLPPITLTVQVAVAAYPSVTNQVTVSSSSLDNNAANDSTSDPTNVRGPDLSTSTKTVQDLNGGEVDPGDVLRYTINLIESGGVAANNVTVTDDIPANTANFSVTTLPAGATNLSTGAGTGTFGTGFLNISGIAVAANGTASVVFDVIVPSTTTPGTPIDNGATVTQPNGPGANPVAPTVIVSPSQVPGAGRKPLYLRRLPSLALSRNPPAAAESDESIAGGDSATWTLTPPLQSPISIPANNISVRLWLRRRGGGGSSRQISVALANSVTGNIGSDTRSYTIPSSSPAEFLFVIPNAAALNFPAGSLFTLTIQQLSPASSSTSTRVYPNGTGASDYSRIELDSNTVINVDSVDAYDAAYSGGTVPAYITPGATAYLRAVISDPFGSFDIANAVASVVDPNNTTVASNVPMTKVADSGAATATYEIPFLIPNAAAAGIWTVRIVGTEGTEGIVTDLGVGTFVVQLPTPALRVQKTSVALADPLNSTTNPKRIPRGVVSYDISVTNTGPGAVDSSSLVITDSIPANTALYVSTASGLPVEFMDGTPASGLTYNYATQVSYSNQPAGSAPYNYTPTPDTDGFDAAVRGIRIAPAGTMAGTTTAGQPSFTIRLRVRID
ncbi:MAG: DUF11 domain-containing protein [Pseudomonadales bacterium]|nr:DUF11 domain-containing protein [Pseudomonadales bacterium]